MAIWISGEPKAVATHWVEPSSTAMTVKLIRYRMVCRSSITAAVVSPLLPARTVIAPTVKVGKIETDILGVDCTNITIERFILLLSQPTHLAHKSPAPASVQTAHSP